VPRIKNRHKCQGIDFVIGQLRDIAKDKEIPAWQRLAALDRLSTIDSIYQIEIVPLTPRVASRAPVPVIGDLKIEPAAPVTEPVVDDEEKKLLEDFNRKYYNKGEKSERSDSKNQ